MEIAPSIPLKSWSEHRPTTTKESPSAAFDFNNANCNSATFSSGEFEWPFTFLVIKKRRGLSSYFEISFVSIPFVLPIS